MLLFYIVADGLDFSGPLEGSLQQKACAVKAREDRRECAWGLWHYVKCGRCQQRLQFFVRSFAGEVLQACCDQHDLLFYRCTSWWNQATPKFWAPYTPHNCIEFEEKFGCFGSSHSCCSLMGALRAIWSPPWVTDIWLGQGGRSDGRSRSYW